MIHKLLGCIDHVNLIADPRTQEPFRDLEQRADKAGWIEDAGRRTAQRKAIIGVFANLFEQIQALKGAVQINDKHAAVTLNVLAVLQNFGADVPLRLGQALDAVFVRAAAAVAVVVRVVVQMTRVHSQDAFVPGHRLHQPGAQRRHVRFLGQSEALKGFRVAKESEAQFPVVRVAFRGAGHVQNLGAQEFELEGVGEEVGAALLRESEGRLFGWRYVVRHVRIKGSELLG